jgi:hypothetical protein
VLTEGTASTQAKCALTNEVIYFVDLIIADTYWAVGGTNSSEDKSAKKHNFYRLKMQVQRIANFKLFAKVVISKDRSHPVHLDYVKLKNYLMEYGFPKFPIHYISTSPYCREEVSLKTQMYKVKVK